MTKSLLLSLLFGLLLSGSASAQSQFPGTLPTGCTNGQVPVFNSSTQVWACGSGGSSGTVTSIATTSPITGGTITTTGTIACATCTTGASLTVNQVPYATATNVLGGSANLVVDASTSSFYLGGSTSSAADFWRGYPQFFVSEQAGSLSPGYISYVYNTLANMAGGVFGMRSRGTPASPTAVQSGDAIVSVEGDGRGATDWFTAGTFAIQAAENWTDDNVGSKARLRLTANGGGFTDVDYLFGNALFTVPVSMAVTGYVGLAEQSAPTAPAANNVVIFAQDSGGGKTQVCARFNTGAVQCFATEP